MRRPRGMKVRKVSVRLGGKAMPVRRRRGRITAVVDLRGRRPGAAVVRIRVVGTRRGKPARSRQTRAFFTCAAPKRS